MTPAEQAEELIRKFPGPPRDKWTREEWLAFLDGWQRQRLGTLPTPMAGGAAVTQLRALGVQVAALLEPPKAAP